MEQINTHDPHGLICLITLVFRYKRLLALFLAVSACSPIRGELLPVIEAREGLSAPRIPLTITFSENGQLVPVVGFTAEDIALSGGTFVDFSGSAATYTLQVIPDQRPASFRVRIAASAAQTKTPVRVTPPNDAPFATWKHRAQIHFPGYAHENVLHNFPVLIVLDEATGFRFSDVEGNDDTPWSDLRFTMADHRTELAYDVESWDQDQRAKIWIKLPALTPRTIIHAYWGKPKQTAPSNNVVFDPDFIGVWHLDTLRNTTTLPLTGEVIGKGVEQSQPGQVGNAVRVTQHGGFGGIKVTDHPALDFGDRDFTLEMWVRKEAPSKGWHNIGEFGKWHTGAEPGKNEWSLGTTDTGNDDKPGFSIEIGDSAHRVNAQENLALNRWTHIAGVRRDTNMSLYVNGEEVGRKTGVKGAVNNVGRNLHFGYFPSQPRLSVRATLDEYRISSSARSAQWIRATHQSIAEPTRFTSIQFEDETPRTSNAAEKTFTAHWAYERPVRPMLPEVSDPSWPKQPIDYFVLARLDEHSFKPSPPADPATWLRRVHLDLIGLPPRLEDLDAFLSDPSDQARERVVDRLLASPHFGERWAQPWLDLARYGDSTGLHEDEIRPSWAWRDWVIHALNKDLPFDQFTIEQLAGDLLPEATQEQKIATGFHRAAPMMLEGGTPKEAARSAQVIDRVNVTGTVWLGTTLECAQCHDHKSDPISQRDYYRLFAYFNNTPGEWGKNVGPGRSAQAGPTVSIGDTTTFVMQEMDKPRNTRIFERGSYEHPKQAVHVGLPDTLFKSELNLASNRLGLAQWIVDPANPLTARVTVNRWWAELFGRGIVSTTDDFGTMGQRPTHPELIDWLAVELVEQDWSFKHLLRTMILSATYAQSSSVHSEILKEDPENIWLSRMSRLRLSAEGLRDNALAIAGLLSPAIGGPPAYPPQPDDLWWIRDDKSPKYMTSRGEDRYRRGLYTIWRRTFLHPSLAIFDAPDRITCAFDRERSNTPLQALTLLNDPMYTEAAFGFARNLQAMNGTLEQRIARAFRTSTGRVPDAIEQQTLVRLYQERADRFKEAPEAARKLIESVRGDLLSRVSPLDREALIELAAWYHVTNTLLNLDETINRG